MAKYQGDTWLDSKVRTTHGRLPDSTLTSLTTIICHRMLESHAIKLRFESQERQSKKVSLYVLAHLSSKCGM
ncbi:hypothetical protein E2C01_064800 [Portunus trituberculatus]|uniref:Uncharacterized protein n=1 Tax=Portunus trituberculatus TaxID=210409 RepID=A0A5B7HPD3_PORTR|nr:hypothetical protein [Portunus trituberculatus]